MIEKERKESEESGMMRIRLVSEVSRPSRNTVMHCGVHPITMSQSTE